jgi:hypothetical protein
MGTDVALAVKEVRAVRTFRCVVADDLGSAHIDGPDAAMGGVQHKKPTLSTRFGPRAACSPLWRCVEALSRLS